MKARFQAIYSNLKQFPAAKRCFLCSFQITDSDLAAMVRKEKEMYKEKKLVHGVHGNRSGSGSLFAFLLAFSVTASSLYTCAAAQPSSGVIAADAYNRAAAAVDAEGESKGNKPGEAAELDRMISEMLQDGPYAEGEAVAVIRAAGAAWESVRTGHRKTRQEQYSIALSDSAAVSQAIEAKLKDGSLAAREAGRRFWENEAYMIVRVVDHSVTTEELLTRLYQDPDVLEAEPDYLLAAPASLTEENVSEEDISEEDISEDETSEDGASEEGAPEEGVTVVGTPEEGAPEYDTTGDETMSPGPGDLTPYQWYADSTGVRIATPEAPEGSGYSLNVPGWNGSEDNASGTIAIMDTGIDVTHPDLQGVLYEFSAEQQEKYGCGPYGKNVNQRQNLDLIDEASIVPEEEYQRDITDHMMHGTHIAGMIAGTWDGSGISGITRGVKLFGVRVYSDDGMAQSSSDIILGFEWLVSIAKEVNLKAVNVSLGTLKSQLVHTIMVNRLGELGVNTVYASGNLGMDMDENIDLGAQNTSPYAIVVNAADPDGKKTQFSCYGQTSTDVFAPGAQILSAVPAVVTESNDGGSFSSVSHRITFFEENTDPSHLAFGHAETFGTETPTVRFFDVCPVKADGSANEDAAEIGKRNTQYGFDDHASWEIGAKALADPEDTWMNQSYRASHGYWMAIPVEDPEKTRWIGGKGAFNDKTHAYSGLTSVLCAAADESGALHPVSIDMRYDEALKSHKLEGIPLGSHAYTAEMNFSSSQWTQWSLDLHYFIKGASYFHTIDEKVRETIGFNLSDPGDLRGIYIWKDKGTDYLLVQMAAMRAEGEDLIQNEGAAYLIDDIALADEEAATGAYTYLNGTSMAAPCVTACLGILAKDEPESASLSESELKMEALERAARLLASVDYDEDLAPYCRTGGRVNLRGQTAFTKKAPLITEARTEGNVLKLTGYFFGEEGKLLVDGEEIAAAAWSDEEITAGLGGLANGSHVAKVINPDEAVMQVIFSLSVADADGDSSAAGNKALFENTLPLPLAHPDFVTERTDGFYGSMAALDDALYILSGDCNGISQGMWRYDISEGQWFHCRALPEELAGMSIENNSLAAADGKIFVYVCRKGLETVDAQLWSYDPGMDEWTACRVEGLREDGGILAFDGRLLFAARLPWFFDEEEPEVEPAIFNFIDLEEGTLVPAEGTIREDAGSFQEFVLSAGGDQLYMFGTIDGDEGFAGLFLTRYTYDSQQNAFEAEDISSSLDEILEDRKNCAFAGLPDGLALITPEKAGSDTWILKNDASSFEEYKRTSCYHTPFAPAASYADGTLYVMAMNTTEPDVLYFRSTRINESH